MPSHKCQTEGRISSLALLASLFTNAAQDAISLICFKDTLLSTTPSPPCSFCGVVFFNLIMCISWKGGMCWCVISQPRALHSQRSHFTSAPSPSSSRCCLYLTTFPSIPVPRQLKITASKLNLEMRGETEELLGFFIFNVAQQVHLSSLSNCTFQQRTAPAIPTPKRKVLNT